MTEPPPQPSPPPPPAEPPKKAGLLPDAQSLCSYLIAFTGILFVTRPTATTGQLLFRLTLMLGGVAGLLILWFKGKKT